MFIQNICSLHFSSSHYWGVNSIDSDNAKIKFILHRTYQITVLFLLAKPSLLDNALYCLIHSQIQLSHPKVGLHSIESTVSKLITFDGYDEKKHKKRNLTARLIYFHTYSNITLWIVSSFLRSSKKPMHFQIGTN